MNKNEITIYFHHLSLKKWGASFFIICLLIGFYFFRNDFYVFGLDEKLSYFEKEKLVNHVFITLSLAAFVVLQINRKFFLKEDLQIFFEDYTATHPNHLSYRDYSAFAALTIFFIILIFYHWGYPSHPTSPEVYTRHRNSLISLSKIRNIYFHFFLESVVFVFNLFLILHCFSMLDLAKFLKNSE